MARRDVTDAMRELARERGYSYRAAAGMTSAQVAELAAYHAARAALYPADAVAARMLAGLAARQRSEAARRKVLAREHAEMCAWVPGHSEACDHWSRHHAARRTR